MNFPVLVLNADYLPHRVVDWQKAFTHIYSKDENAAHVAATYDTVVKDSMGRAYNIPAVIVLNNYVKNGEKPCTFSKGAIHLRDKFTCQYCGVKKPENQLTVDHVMPRSRIKNGNANTFQNCVSSCQKCNAAKADKTPKEAGMQLRSIPKHITRNQKELLKIRSKKYPKEWAPYIEGL